MENDKAVIAKEIDALKQRLASLETSLNGGQKKTASGETENYYTRVAAEIEDLETKIESTDMPEEDDDDEMEEVEVEGDETEECDEPELKMASDKVAKKGDSDNPEVPISQDYLSDVENLLGKGSLATKPSARDVAYARIAKLKMASDRLDRIASHLETAGKLELAKRVDRIADKVDAKIGSIEKSL